ncbi:complex I subunit 5 family protein [Desulfonatronum sp. SC1]|uniref:complex I subunit 5 family protein n=1 Tax=Desulfonatronum sp. SC1 TaxID=2109626 RepID=UPI000D30DEAA|nr:proton-conducting transporter membrane subunit [Desulfonatronum sp. SC1]PTN35312.1 proton-conducting membrane transporter [Desulfonatronum sp. SC1]
MTMTSWLPLIVLCSSLITGLIIFLLPEERSGWRTALNMTGATVKVVGVFVMAWGVLVRGAVYEARFTMGLGFDFVLQVDLLSLAFVSLSSNLWFLTTLYAVGYLEGSRNRSRFFGFFSLCVTASTGVALAGNLITFFIFYEFLTLVTYPLVIHQGTPQALAAGRTYLWYAMGAGAVLFLGVVGLQTLAGPFDFVSGGVLGAMEHIGPWEARVIFALLICGLAVKNAFVPLHGWLPAAMVAPAPVSALLHAVAVVKAGAFGVLRVVQDVFGKDFASELGVLEPLAAVVVSTILFGSLRALMQNELKRRLAYSTVSQVSYIALGAVVLGPLATVGGLAHLVHQGIMKITLFFCAGIFARSRNIHRIDQMDGLGRTMPMTMALFTIAALGMIGVPPVAGFVSKWYLAQGGIQAGQDWVVVVLVLSSLLNAAYFLPILYRAWFRPCVEGPELDGEQARCGIWEAPWMLLLPTLATAFFSLAAGVFAGWEWSPLGVAQMITTGRGAFP